MNIYYCRAKFPELISLLVYNIGTAYMHFEVASLVNAQLRED